jgi:hypothetical protein
LNADGRLDLVISNNNGPPTLYLNRLVGAGHWLMLDLEGRRSNRDAVGARVRVEAGGRVLTRWVEVGSGYASQAPHLVHFGLGNVDRVEQAEILWPSGQLDRPEISGVDRLVQVTESEARN